MHFKHTECPCKISLEETEEGYTYQNFRQKAKAAGLGHCNGHSRKRGFCAMIHKHIQAVHRYRHKCHENKPE